jgi:YfiH family protein
VTSAADASAAGAPHLRVAAWREVDGLEHGFFGRSGGVSAGHAASLNLSDRVGDEPAAVAANWRRAGAALSGLAFVRTRQVHGDRVLRIERAEAPVAEADGMIARGTGFGLAVLTADCVPILAVARAARAVMALHAGWRGTLAGVTVSGLAEAQGWLGVGPEAWHFALGPSIDGCCYEVEAHIGEQLVDRWGAMPDAWQRSGSHGQLDLRAANRRLLMEQGVPESQIVTVGPCTSCRSGEYFSHRRSGGRAGRQLSAIGWRS